MELYHTETQEDFNALLEKLKKELHDNDWIASDSAKEKWGKYRQGTCVSIYGLNISVGKADYFERLYPQVGIKKYKAEQDKVAKWFNDATNTMKAMSAVGASVKNENNDNINNPSHYTAGGIETLDYIKAKVKDYPSYAAGNILKYVSRYSHKNGIEDLKKAQFYLNDLIKEMESEEE
ncbi:DUF3310 domain-containing protein [Listeria seeligeri]|uniref:DUF3310 domain-containing protein n=1 Tax=Listeria seeligeri TaxID=1640 RepID=UPI0022EB5D21|nr:DUF3310 domain-containing protein [Listeria seeligeri]